VGQEVAEQFPAAFRTPGPDGKSFIALPEYNKQQLMDCGVPPDGIEIHPHCTICNNNYHSFRRDGDASGRMLAVIAMHSQS
jgi:copper oxidase (laccase) domain-containing protein